MSLESMASVMFVEDVRWLFVPVNGFEGLIPSAMCVGTGSGRTARLRGSSRT